jgi:hypothetical protein
VKSALRGAFYFLRPLYFINKVVYNTSQVEQFRETETERNYTMAKKPTLQDIFDKFEECVGEYFPNGDPIDGMIDWLRKNGLTVGDVDKAIKKHGGAKSYTEYMAQAWDDFKDDQLHDAEQALKRGQRELEMHINNNSLARTFVEIKDGKPVATRNPWKSN